MWNSGKTAQARDLAVAMRTRASIRRQISTRRSVQNGEHDRLADQLDQAASVIDELLNMMEAAHGENL